MKQITFACIIILLLAGCSQHESDENIQKARSALSAYVIDFWVHRDTTAIARAITPNLVYHYEGQIVPGDYPSHVQALRNYGGAFPDLNATIDVFTFDGEFGAAVTSWSGTQLGIFPANRSTGMNAIPPTGKKVSWPVHYIFRMEGDRIAELWEAWDEGGVSVQLINAASQPAK